MRIQVSFDHDGYNRKAEDVISRNLMPAMQDLVDYLAAHARARLSEATEKDFDRPIGFTRNAFAYRRLFTSTDAVKTIVYVLPDQARYLGIEIFGGTRRAGDYATEEEGSLQPGRDAKDFLDEFGNLPRGFVTDEKQDGAYWAKIGARKLPTLLLPGRGRPGGRSPILAVIEPEVQYRPRLPFYDVVPRTCFESLPNAIAKFESRI